MIAITANAADLKKALSITGIAAGKLPNHIRSHALFTVTGDKCYLCATDEDKFAESTFTLAAVEGGDIQFTADPKNLQKVLTNASSDVIRFTYEPETKTLKIYTSENKRSFLSFASFDPDKFMFPDLSALEPKHTITKEIFLDGTKFAQGYILEKDPKFSDVYISDGVFYGANGNTKVGCFTSPDLKECPDLILRRAVTAPLSAMVERAGITDIVINVSDKAVSFSSEDRLHNFGFRKSTATPPKFPISTQAPSDAKFSVDRAVFLKKLNILSLTSWEDVGIKVTIKDKENLEMETVSERPSYEVIPCVCGSEEPIEFVIQCNKFKAVLGLFKASHVDVYITKNKCTIYSAAEIIIEEGEEEVKKSFTAVGLMTLARIVK